MSQPQDYSFVRYLAAKKSVDDRALNRHVWETLKATLAAQDMPSPIRILEIGAGIGTMIQRLLAWDLTDKGLDITAIDLDPENIVEARRRLVDLGRGQGAEVREDSTGQLSIKWGNRDVKIALEAVDFSELIRREANRGYWHVLMANAFLDLVNPSKVLPDLRGLLADHGLCYFTINFDGATIFEPPIDHALDQKIETLYHLTMDERITDGQPSGDSKTGRHLLGLLRGLGIEILDAGSSDWVIFASGDKYPADEAYFLHHIVNTVHEALHGSVELDADQFEEWVRQRHLQIERGELVYIAHQLDLLART